MENASKALIMAGSVLIALAIIGALVFMFSGLGKIKQTEANMEKQDILLKYNQQIEGYCKPGLYGSELLSLTNLIQDYNKRQSDLNGYKKIELEVYMNKISSAMYIKNDYKDYSQLISDINKIEDKLEDLKNIELCGETLEKISGMRTIEIEQLVNNYNKTSTKKYTVEYVETQKYNYLTIKSEYTTFKLKRFNAPQVEQDKNNGRITKIVFKEYGL